MVDSGLQPDDAVFTRLIMDFGIQKKLDTVYELLKEMQEKGHPPMGKRTNGDHATRIYNKMSHKNLQEDEPERGRAINAHVQHDNEILLKGICRRVHQHNMY
ncbi:unnamed protein product [Arabis nemorensis]|uniref:Pentacotripeptide-repeat region of PRORP domain-containing protein n=1 Tax=Arabis nemorensis TaxID=586526 RepID=A0A565BZ67_9BRAS|nr:unnamed protein product [Arabis nemorensis]